MHSAIHAMRRPVMVTGLFRSSVLISIAIVFFVASAMPVSAASVPQITGISPAGGPIAGGTGVTITGSGLSGATDVRFGEKSGTALIVVNDSCLTVISPPNPVGTVAISVTGAAGIESPWDASAMYMYEEFSRPRISGITPSSGPVAGGTTVNITGSGFTGTEEVRFGEKYGSGITVVDDSHLSVTTPASFPGLVPVSVKNAVGTGSSREPSAMYQYEFPFPELAGISPSSGPAAGGTVVTITGSGLSGATDVRFGGIPGTGLTVLNDRELTVISPPNPAGTVGLSVINPDHAGYSAGSASVFRYYIPIPKMTTITPSSGSTAGGTVVFITGSGFTGATSVRFGEKNGTDLTVLDDSSIRVRTPASSPGLFPVSITGPRGTGGSLEPSTMFRYEFPPSATTVTKAATPARDGSGNMSTALSAHATAPVPAGTAASGTMQAPGFEAIAGLSALGAFCLLRETIP